MVLAGLVYAHVQLVAVEYDEAIGINQNHNDEQCTNGTIEPVVATKIVHIKRKANGGQDGYYGGDSCPGAYHPELAFYCAAKVVTKGNDQIENGYSDCPLQNDKAIIGKPIVEPAFAIHPIDGKLPKGDKHNR